MILRAIILALIAPLLAAPIYGDPVSAAPDFMPVAEFNEPDGLRGKVPGASYAFCMAQRALCSFVLPALPLPDDAMAILNRVNRDVNAGIAFRADEPSIDAWEIEPVAGDCEDYVVTKLARLVAAGIPRDTLRLATAQLPDGRFHIVLVAQTWRGSFILDNRTDAILPWRGVNYRWLAMETNGAGTAMAWHEVLP